jgi:hypothetical protein
VCGKPFLVEAVARKRPDRKGSDFRAETLCRTLLRRYSGCASRGNQFVVGRGTKRSGSGSSPGVEFGVNEEAGSRKRTRPRGACGGGAEGIADSSADVNSLGNRGQRGELRSSTAPDGERVAGGDLSANSDSAGKVNQSHGLWTGSGRVLRRSSPRPVVPCEPAREQGVNAPGPRRQFVQEGMQL